MVKVEDYEPEYRFTVRWLHGRNYHFRMFPDYDEANAFYNHVVVDPDCFWAELAEDVVHRRINRLQENDSCVPN